MLSTNGNFQKGTGVLAAVGLLALAGVAVAISNGIQQINLQQDSVFEAQFAATGHSSSATSAEAPSKSRGEACICQDGETYTPKVNEDGTVAECNSNGYVNLKPGKQECIVQFCSLSQLDEKRQCMSIQIRPDGNVKEEKVRLDGQVREDVGVASTELQNQFDRLNKKLIGGGILTSKELAEYQVLKSVFDEEVKNLEAIVPHSKQGSLQKLKEIANLQAEVIDGRLKYRPEDVSALQSLLRDTTLDDLAHDIRSVVLLPPGSDSKETSTETDIGEFGFAGIRQQKDGTFKAVRDVGGETGGEGEGKKESTEGGGGFGSIPAVKAVESVADGVYDMAKDATYGLVRGVETAGRCALSLFSPTGYYENCLSEGPVAKRFSDVYYGGDEKVASAGEDNQSSDDDTAELTPFKDRQYTDPDSSGEDLGIAPSGQPDKKDRREDERDDPDIRRPDLPRTQTGNGGSGGGGAGGLGNLLQGLLGGDSDDAQCRRLAEECRRTLSKVCVERYERECRNDNPDDPSDEDKMCNKWEGTSLNKSTGRCECPRDQAWTGRQCEDRRQNQERDDGDDDPQNQIALAAELSCAPEVQDVGAPVLISYACRGPEGTQARADGFKAEGLTGSTSTTAKFDESRSDKRTRIFGLTCIKDGKTKTDSCTMQVNKPTITAVVKQGTVQVGGRADIGWVTTGIKTCTLEAVDGDGAAVQEFNEINAPVESSSGSVTTPELQSDLTVSLICTTFAGSKKKSDPVVVEVE